METAQSSAAASEAGTAPPATGTDTPAYSLGDTVAIAGETHGTVTGIRRSETGELLYEIETYVKKGAAALSRYWHGSEALASAAKGSAAVSITAVLRTGTALASIPRESGDGDFFLMTPTSTLYLCASGKYDVVAQPAGGDYKGPAFYTATGLPGVTLGSDGDYYLNAPLGTLYQRVSGTWKLAAKLAPPAGANAPMAIMRMGPGAPASAGGADGDFFLDHTNQGLHKRTSGVYTLVAAMAAPGVNGTVWRKGTGAPAPSLGAVNDYYLDQVGHKLYQRNASAYVAVARI
jgi:hypothetical protein